MLHRHLASIILFGTFFLLTGSSNAISADNSSPPDEAVVQVLCDNNIFTALNVAVPSELLQPVEIDGDVYHRPSRNFEPVTNRLGWPELPIINRLILVPPTTGIRLDVHSIECRYVDNWTPFIVGENYEATEFDRPGEPADDFAQTDGFWPPEPVVMGEPAILRGYRIVPVTIYPVQYNPATRQAKYNERLDFDLRYEGEGTNVVVNSQRRRPSSSIQSVLEALVENPPRRDAGLPRRGSYLLIYPNVQGVRNSLQPLIDWRARQGWEVHLQQLNNGAAQADILNPIQAAYNNWACPPEMVCLVGDADGAISLAAYSNITDLGYVCLEGNDILADADIGRLSVSSVQELDRVVAKIVSYENDPWMQDTDWFRQGMVLAGSGGGFSGVLKSRWVRREWLDRGFNNIHEWYYNAPFGGQTIPQFMQSECERGVAFVTYRGWVGMDGISADGIMNYRRHQRYPVAVILTCMSGHFVGGTFAQSEAFLRSQGGAIGAYGLCTAGTHPPYNNALFAGIFAAFLKKGMFELGTACNYGRYELYRQYNGFEQGNVTNFSNWLNLMGDPASHMWTGVPQLVDAAHSQTLATGASHCAVRVTSRVGNNPVPEALVCLYKADNNFQQVVATDADGTTNFVIPPDALTAGNLLVTVTKHNVKPYLGQIAVSRQQFYLGAESPVIVDDDNGNGIANPGESFLLSAELTNFGSAQPQGAVTVTAESFSLWAAIADEPVELNAAPQPNQSAEINFAVQIDDCAPNGTKIPVAVMAQSGQGVWRSTLELTIQAPNIEITSLNFNGALTRGMVRDLDIVVTNAGQQNIGAFSARVWSENPIVTIVVDSAGYRALNTGRSSGVNGQRFRLRAHPFTIPGMPVTLVMAVETAAGFRDTSRFTFTVGQPAANDPFGPDKYGYVCYDSRDALEWEMRPVYDWLEIDPNVQGFRFRGTLININDGGEDLDQSAVVQLPFNFQYYGRNFNQLTVCTNGWAAFGDWRELADFRNRRIASSGGPNAHLAVFWDDLCTGRILYFYDRQAGRFIVEWNTMRNLSSGSNETFQLILYDPAVVPTPTGDGIIVYQYRDITNNGQGGPSNDTPFATVGIGNLDDTDGLEYTYYNTYTRGANTLQSQMAILFTTSSRYITGALAGRITDLATGLPVRGAQITTTRGFWGETNADGRYFIGEILINDDYSLTVTAPGYNDSTWAGPNGNGFTIAEDETLVVDIALLHPEVRLSIQDVNVAVRDMDSLEIEFNLRNSGNGHLSWRTLKQIQGGPEFEAWELRQTERVGQILEDDRIEGVVWAEDHFFISGANGADPNWIYILDREFNLQGGFVQPGQSQYGMKDLEWDGELIWGSGEQNIYGFTTDGEVRCTIRAPTNPVSAVAWDSDRNLLWVAGIVSNNIFGLDLDGRQIMTIARDSLRLYGLAYWPEDPDGKPLYIFSLEQNSGRQAVYKVNPTDRLKVFVTYLEPPGGGPPGGAYISNEFDTFNWTFLTVSNASGGGNFDRVDIWQLAPRMEWMQIEPTAGELDAGSIQNLNLTLSRLNLPQVTFAGDLVFQHNASGGRTILPVTMELNRGPAPNEQILHLSRGWNIVSLNVEPENNDVREIVRPLVEADALLMVKDGQGRFYAPRQGFINIPNWDAANGYQMYLSAAAELHIIGMPVPPDRPIDLTAGWNLKAYFPRQPVDARVALSGVAQQLLIAKDGQGRFYLPALNYSNMGALQEGQGYQYKVSENVRLIYRLGNFAGAPAPNPLKPTHFILANAGGGNLSLLALADNRLTGWELGVFAESAELVGAGCFDKDGRCGLAVWGNDDHRNGMKTGQKMMFKLWDGVNEHNAEASIIEGSQQWSVDGITIASIAVESDLPSEFALSAAYPNPFNNLTRIDYALKENSKVSLMVFDIAGRTAFVLTDANMRAGRYTALLNAEDLNSGVYIIRLEAVGEKSAFTAARKVVLVK
ncbi:MAG: T9SS type A sorting domain-containing protein [Calditrichaeota bacterium]|nr:T9SS type A sorting domain-containing protein [Calditrichota bacterium]